MFRDRPSIEATSSPLCELPSRARSAVTNHKDMLPGLDGRSATARRFRDLVNAFVADMGGLDRCSEVKLGLVRRLAATTVQAEMLEARMVNGDAIDIAMLCTLASTTVRLSQRLRSRASSAQGDAIGGRIPGRQNSTSHWRCAWQVRGGDRMIPRVPRLREALSDPNLLGTAVAGDSWRSWRALLIAAMGEKLSGTSERSSAS